MTDNQQKELADRLSDLSSKRTRLDVTALRKAASSGREMLVDAHVDAEKVFPDIERGSALEASDDNTEAKAGEGEGQRAALAPVAPLSVGKRTRVRPAPPRSKTQGAEMGKSAQDTVSIKIFVSKDLHRDVKIHAAKCGASIQELVVEWIESGLGQVK